MKRAIVLLSGGLDSATTLYYARSKGYRCHCLIFDYGQRHRREIEGAKKIAQMADSKWRIVKIKLPWKGSSLLDKKTKLPITDYQLPLPATQPAKRQAGIAIPSTYVPARNIIFLSFALSFAEASAADSIFIGANAVDYSGYPDCRPEFLEAFRAVARTGMKKGRALNVEAPLIDKSKKEIIQLARGLGVPLELTWSCYKGGRRPCGACDSCRLRAKGFKEAGLPDPLLDNDSSRVTEVFPSVQGEGIFTGEPQIFIRFAKCNLSCDYCDTPDRTGLEYSARELLDRVRGIKNRTNASTVSITGGEPLLHADFLRRFLPLLKRHKFRIYLETNGSLPAEMRKVLDLVDIIAMDMKMPTSQEGKTLWTRHEEFLKTASRKEVFVKIVITDKTCAREIKKAVSIVNGIDPRIPLVVQPATPANKVKSGVSADKLLEFQALAKSTLSDVRIVPQMHKVWGVK